MHARCRCVSAPIVRIATANAYFGKTIYPCCTTRDEEVAGACTARGVLREDCSAYMLCAQSMRNRTGEDVAYSFRAPPDNPFSAARLSVPRALANVLHDHLVAETAQVILC